MTQNMALMLYYCFTTFLVISITSSVPAASAEEFKVGGNNGWRPPSAANETEMYTRWAATRRFHLGDTLRFEYKNDSVLVVDKWGFYHCDLSHPVSTFNDGNTVCKLERPGPVYFVSADPEHCKNGQRLMVEVISPHSRPSTSASSHAPSPFSTAGSLPELVLFYVVFNFIAASVNM